MHSYVGNLSKCWYNYLKADAPVVGPPPQGWRLETERCWIECVCSKCMFSAISLLMASLGSLVGLWAHLRSLWAPFGGLRADFGGSWGHFGGECAPLLFSLRSSWSYFGMPWLEFGSRGWRNPPQRYQNAILQTLSRNMEKQTSRL